MDQNKQIAGGITFLVCGVIVIWLLVTRLTWQAVYTPPEPHPYITMADDEEFIEVEVVTPPTGGNDASAPAQTPEDVSEQSQPAPQSGVDLSTQGPKAQPVQPVVQPKPSPVKETPKPTPPKPAAAVDNKKAEEEKAMAQRTRSSVTNAFANANNRGNAQNGSKDEGTAGRRDGNPDSAASPNSNGKKIGATSGTVGGGWKMPAYSRNIPSNQVGSVVFEVQVNADGSVGKVTPVSNTGLGDATTAKCIEEIRRHRFTHSDMENARPTTARVTFTFRDPQP